MYYPSPLVKRRSSVQQGAPFLLTRRPSCPAVVRRNSGAMFATPTLNSQGGLQYRRPSVLVDTVNDFLQFSQGISQQEWAWRDRILREDRKDEEDRRKRESRPPPLPPMGQSPRNIDMGRRAIPETIHEDSEDEDLLSDLDDAQLSDDSYDGYSSGEDMMSEDGDIAFAANDPSDWFLEEEEDDEDEPTFAILEKAELDALMHDTATQAAGQMDLPYGEAALILQYFNWDMEKLLPQYFERPEFYRRQAGVCVAPVAPMHPEPTTYSCVVCFEEVPWANSFALGCGHRYCTNCWSTYLHSTVATAGTEVVNTACMYPKCDVRLTCEAFERLADPRDFERYRYFMVKRFVESDPHLTFCPSPLCGNAVRYQGLITASNNASPAWPTAPRVPSLGPDPPAVMMGRPNDVVECHCGQRFCFSCGHEKHNPVSCQQLAEWRVRNQDDQESISMVHATSKPCFHCGIPTERVLGCNHMTCRKEQGGCGGEWCWMCRGDWRTHGAHTGGFYSCNKYDESVAVEADTQAEKLRTQQSRFLHYFNRFFNHDMLMKQAVRVRDSGDLEAKMLSFRDETSRSPDFLMEAIELLIECRRILKYTYTLGYYLQDATPAKAFFEYLQANAEGITERLSEGFYLPVAQIDSEDMKNRIRVTRKYINNLVVSIEEGLGIEGGLEGDLGRQPIEISLPPVPEPALPAAAVAPQAPPTSSVPTL
eukprot:TRINITY_DN3851_c0_g1_i1.p1 TRINITY_DN3851_c0_g1~~TRINITY_DN3851_c0_g1_i1.p1  ORF type:complete len:806 (-),score=211.65 TRINITY_DN3851_c0_g1_i1:218-2338(-)